jgi:hypothetical protein
MSSISSRALAMLLYPQKSLAASTVTLGWLLSPPRKIDISPTGRVSATANLDAIRLVSDIVSAILDFLVDFLCRVNESLQREERNERRSQLNRAGMCKRQTHSRGKSETAPPVKPQWTCILQQKYLARPRRQSGEAASVKRADNERVPAHHSPIVNGTTYVLDVLSCLSRRLQKYKTVLIGESLALLKRDGAPVLEVTFVTDQHDGHV